MAQFKYFARNGQGKKIVGTLEANDSDAVASYLLEQGLTPIEINLSTAQLPKWLGNFKNLYVHPLKREDFIFFCRQLYTLYKAGVALSLALRRIEQATKHKGFKQTLYQIALLVEEGMTLADAITRFPRYFSPLICNMIRIGEETGRLEEALLQLAKYLELEEKTSKRFKSVMRYPLIVIFGVLAALVVVNYLVIPAFAQMFNSFHTQLPLATRVLLNTSNFMVQHWLLLLLAVAVIVLGLVFFARTPKGRYLFHRLQLYLPVVGGIIKMILLARFARSLAMVIRTGLPLSRGVSFVADAISNDYLALKLAKIEEYLNRGDTLTQSCQKTKFFPNFVMQMLYTGEESGDLEEMLDQVADYYEEQTDYNLRRLTDLLEPILLVIVAGLVLILAIGIFLPLWNMTGLMKR